MLSIAEIKAYAKLAADVYEDPCPIAGKVFELPQNKFRMVVIEKTEPGVMAAVESVEFTIVLRGTANAENAFDDVKFRPKIDPVTGIYMHRGFHEPIAEAWAALVPYIAERQAALNSAPMTFKIVGHSLGGSAAVGIAACLAKTLKKVAHLVTFGQPMLGPAEDLATILQGVTYERVVNKADTVPGMPPVRRRDESLTVIGMLSMIFMRGKQYGHTGGLRHMFPAPDTEAPPKFEWSIKGLVRWLGSVGKRSMDHPMKQYIASLDAVGDGR